MTAKATTKAATQTTAPMPAKTPAAIRDKEAKARAALEERNANLVTLKTELLGARNYDAKVLLEETRFYLQNSAMAMLEAGKRLLLIKENEGDAFWPMLEELDLDKKFVQKLITSAAKFCLGLPSQQTQRLADLGKSKMLELLALDDEEVKAIADGETVLGLTMDAVDRMGVAELRKEIRKQKQKMQTQEEATDRIIDDKNKKIEKLTKELSHLRRLTPDEELQRIQERDIAILEDLQEAATDAQLAIQRFLLVVGSALKDEPTDTTRDYATSTTQWLFQRVNEAALKHQIPVDFAQIVTPAWLRG